MAVNAYTGCDTLHVMQEAKNYNAFLVQEVHRYANGHRALLDFGAGIGTFAREMRERGFSVTCVEPDYEMQEHLKNAGFEVYPSLDHIPANSVEQVYTLNVLEHIEDDTSALEQIYNRLKGGGRLFIYVPAYPILFSSMDKHVGHFRRYRRRPLMNLLRTVGFTVEKASYVDSLGFPASLAFKFLGPESGELNPKSLKLYDTAIFPFSRLLDQIVGWWFGKNLRVVCSKPSSAEPRGSSSGR